MKAILITAILSIWSIVSFSQKSYLEIYTYGDPDIKLRNARQIVAARYGFSYRAVADCNVSQELVDSVSVHNQMIYKQIDDLAGKNWQKRFESEVKKEQKLVEKIKKAADKLLMLPTYHEYLIEKKDDKTYVVKVIGQMSIISHVLEYALTSKTVKIQDITGY